MPKLSLKMALLSFHAFIIMRPRRSAKLPPTLTLQHWLICSSRNWASSIRAHLPIRSPLRVLGKAIIRAGLGARQIIAMRGGERNAP